LTPSQVEGFKTLFSPNFSPGLVHTGGPVSPENFSKRLSSQELTSLNVPTPKIAASAKLNATNANTLRGWLNENASSSIPGWVSTVIGIVVPAAWVGISADVAIQLINGSGDAGRITLANIAGTVSENGFVGVIHRVVSKSDGKQAYVWNYTYTANLNGTPTTFLLGVCSADVVHS
jgi:hypothetical protein